MTLRHYNRAKEKLFYIWNLKAPVEQVVKCVNLMYRLLLEEWGFLCKLEKLTKIVNDTTTIGLSKPKIQQLLLMEKY
jgi:hypothetical protein